MTQRTALYARVSTTRQQEERTVASQLAALEKAAEGMGLVVAAEHRYVDEGYSGSRLDRPGLDALRDAAADGLLDLVLVYAPVTAQLRWGRAAGNRTDWMMGGAVGAWSGPSPRRFGSRHDG